MNVHCYDGPPGPDPQPTKETIRVYSIGELRVVVDHLIESGRTDVKLELSPALLVDPVAYDILEEIVSKHPKSNDKEL